MDKESYLIIGQRLTSRVEALEEYLKTRSDKVSTIGFKPLGTALGSHVLTFTLRLVLFTLKTPFRKKTGAVVGVSHFNGLLALITRCFGKADKVIYYCLDFYRVDGYKQMIENWLDKFVAKHADEVWDISPRIRKARNTVNSKIVPLGYDKSFYRNNHSIEDDLVFVGVVHKQQGFDLLKSVPIQFDISVIGDGPYLKELMAHNNRNFKFYGFIKDVDEMLNIVSHCRIGVSLWSDKGNSYYGDPGKTKLYLVCGIPVICSKHTVFAKVIERENAGIVIGYSQKEFIRAYISIMTNYKLYKKNALRVAKEYCSAERIFDEAFK